MTTLDEARRAAALFVRDEAGFAQVVSRDDRDFPVGRSMTAFLGDDWSVALVQRRIHQRNRQFQRDPHVLVIWVGDPAPGATNDHPHVFDIGRLPPRAVFIRGTVRFMDDEWTVARYREQLSAQRADGHTRAPVRDDSQAAADLTGLLVVPHRIRLEGFGVEAESFTWTVPPTQGDS